MKEKSKKCIFDTNIFLLGFQINLIEGEIYTTPSVIEEIKVKRYSDKNRTIISRIKAAIETKKLIIKIPTEIYIAKVKLNSKNTGDFKALSEADFELIALALELKDKYKQEIILYTNDYSMENLCMELNIPFSPLGKNGIDSKIIWEIYCPFCQNIFQAEDFKSYCERCGQKLKRRKKKV
ncbi:MAG: NOB1 family endonuclease [Promethearchaeota archaeon]